MFVFSLKRKPLVSGLPVWCLCAAALLVVLVAFATGIVRVDAAANDSSIQLKKDPMSGMFLLTVRDPDGIQEFSLVPEGKFPYGGGLSGCARSFVNDNVRFVDPDDFTPVMRATVLDCGNQTTELTIAAPVGGIARSVAVKKEAPLPPPPPQKPVEGKSQEKSVGSLSADDIRYPVPDLGGCADAASCRSYCDNADRAEECFAFAKKYHLVSDGEAKSAADKFLNVKNGPGGCNSWASCESYCNSIGHLDACISFAENTGYYPPEKLAEARKFQAIAKSGKQFPGGCTDRNACEVYCGVPDHMDECLSFAEATGFMPKEEIEEARKFMTLMRRGESPGGCTSKEQCEKYCFEGNHTDECVSFAEKAGVISAEDAAIARKTGGKGPGGCHSKGQCEAYCQEHSEECFGWAREHGLVNEKDLQKMGEGMKRFRENLDKMPPESVRCLKDALGEDNFNKMLNGTPVFDRAIEGKMKSCFAQVTAGLSKQLRQLPPEAAQCISTAVGEDGLRKLQSGEVDPDFNFESLEGCFQQLQGSFGGGGNFDAGGFSGPGECKTTEECIKYCTANPQACQNFNPPGGANNNGHSDNGNNKGQAGNAGGFVGPGGCKSQEECTVYCTANHEDEACKKMMRDFGGRNGFQGGGMLGGGRESGEKRDGFAECGIAVGTPAVYVCAVNGKDSPPGVETTYFNECHARQRGAEILHAGMCKGHISCTDIANPVCGTDGASYTSECAAKEHGAEVAHGGICTNANGEMPKESRIIQPRAPSVPVAGGFSGPGGCKNQEECTAYCKDHLDECGALMGGWAGSPPSSEVPISPPPASVPSAPPSGQVPQEYCAAFALAPKCEYVGTADSQSYLYCKQCFPDK